MSKRIDLKLLEPEANKQIEKEYNCVINIEEKLIFKDIHLGITRKCQY